MEPKIKHLLKFIKEYNHPLINNDVKIKIVCNIIKQKRDPFNVDSLTLLQDTIRGNFLWSETPEGHTYWENLYKSLNKQKYV